MSDGELAIRIWEAKAGGFVLAHSVETPGRGTASRHARPGEVMQALEDYCRELEAPHGLPLDPEAVRRLHVSDLLEEIARLSTWRRRFRDLAGETLDAFERRLQAVSQQHGEGAE